MRWRDLVLDEVAVGSPNDDARKFVTLMALGFVDKDEQVMVRKEKRKKSQGAAMDEWGSSLLLFLAKRGWPAKGVARALQNCCFSEVDTCLMH
jgi:hypothetical protein